MCFLGGCAFFIKYSWVVTVQGHQIITFSSHLSGMNKKTLLKWNKYRFIRLLQCMILKADTNTCRHLLIFSPFLSLSLCLPTCFLPSFADSVASSSGPTTKTNCLSTTRWRFLARTGHSSRLRSQEPSIKRNGPRTGATGPRNSPWSTDRLNYFKSPCVALILSSHWN